MKIVLAGLLSLMLTTAPLSALLYWYTPTPQFVEEAHAALRAPIIHASAADAHQKVDMSLRTIEELRNDPRSHAEQVALQVTTRQSATVIAWIPIAYSISAGMVLGWCLTLLGAYGLAHHAHKCVNRSRNFTHEQSMIFKGLMVLASVNFTVLVILAPQYAHVLDSVLMWNLGMLSILLYYSLNLGRTRFFQSFIVTEAVQLDPNVARHELERMFPDQFWVPTTHCPVRPRPPDQ